MLVWEPILSQFCIWYRNQSFDLNWKSKDWFLCEMQHCAEIGSRNQQIFYNFPVSNICRNGLLTEIHGEWLRLAWTGFILDLLPLFGRTKTSPNLRFIAFSFSCISGGNLCCSRTKKVHKPMASIASFILLFCH